MKVDSRQTQSDYSMKDSNGKFKETHTERNSGEIMTVQNEAYTIKDLLDKFTSGVFTPEMLYRSGGEDLEYKEGIMDSMIPEPYIDRTFVEEHSKVLNSKIESIKKAKKSETTKKLANEEVSEKEPDKKDSKSTNNT